MRAGSPRPAAWSQDHGIPVVVLFPEIEFDQAQVHRPGRRAGQVARLLHRGRVRRLPLPGRQVPGRTGHARRLRPRAAGRRRAGGGRHGQAGAGPQVPLGGGRLPAARGAPHRVQDRREAGLRAGQGRGAAGAQGPQRRDAHDRSRQRHALQVQDRHGAAGQGGQRREVHAARLHHRRRLRHHRGLQALPDAADPGRGLSEVQERLAGLRDAEERAGGQEAARRSS